jgi:twinkle protein
MTEIIHQPCPYPSCGSSNAFSYNSEKMVGKCHSCDENYPSNKETYDWVSKAYPTKPLNKGVQREMADKEDFMDYRGVTSNTYKFYKSLTQFDGDTPVSHSYLYPSGKRKIRSFPKTFVTDPGFRTDELFGMNLFNGGSSMAVTICEGEMDCMSAFQMLGSKYPCVSLPSATPKSTLIANCKPWLDSFDKIYLSLDADDKAEKFAMALMHLYPGKVYKVSHDKYKDANEFLQDGAAQAYKNAWYNARLYTPSNILSSPDDFIKVYEDTPDHVYVPTGIDSLDDKILGLMQGHFTVILAETSIGKTELMRKLEYNILKNHPHIRIATWHLEESKLRSLLGLVSYELKDNLTRKDLIVQKGRDQEVRDAIKRLSDNTNYIQFSLNESSSVEDLVEQIRVLKAVYDCNYIFFEPIQDVLSISDEGEKESKLASLAIQLSKMANDLNIGIVTIAHTNENGDIKYCKMIGQRASVRIELKRDKGADNPLDRNTLKMYVTKNRPCSVEGPAGELVFDLDTFTLNDKEEGF